MERPIYVAFAVLTAGIIAVFGGAYLLHIGLREGSNWKILVGVVIAICGLLGFGSTAKVFDRTD